MTEINLSLSDRALSPGETDLLNRGDFVSNLVEVISNAPEGESNVFALYGKWGEGKTSTLSLMEEKFEKRLTDGKRSPLIIKFNPWVFSGREKLFQAFFEDIGNTIGSSDDMGGVERSKKFKRLASYTSLIGSSISSVDSVLNLVGLSVPGSQLSGKALKKISGILKTGADAEDATTLPNLAQLRSALVEDLKEADAPLLVVLDDIDRLPPPELVEIFQLLKSIADLPNVHYLVLCDRKNVEDNLIKQGFSGDYLEKIIQFGIHLPTVLPDRLSTLLLEGVSQIFTEFSPNDSRINDAFLESLKNGILPGTFRTLRNIKRYLGDLRLSVPIHCQNNYFELNPQQFLFFTALRLLCPRGIERLQAERKTFVFKKRSFWSSDDSSEQNKNLTTFVDETFSEILVEENLSQFAPLFRELISPWEAQIPSEEHALENRLLHSSMWFDCYFTLERPQRVVSVEQAGELSQSITRELSETSLVVKQITDDVGYTPLLRYLVTAAPSLFCDESSNLMTALLSNEENPLCEDPNSDFFESNIFESFLYWLRESPDEEREERALKVLNESNNYRFYSLCYFMLGGEVNSSGGPHRPLRRVEKPLMKATAKVIEQKAEDGDDLTEHYFGDVHDLWHHWGSRSRLKAWIKANTETDEQLVRYLTSLGEFRDATHEGETAPRASFFLRHERLASFPSLQSGIKRTKALLGTELASAEEKLILERAQSAFRMAATFRRGKNVLPKELPEWVGASFSNCNNLNLASHYLFVIPCVGPDNSNQSEETLEQTHTNLQRDLTAKNLLLGSLLIRYQSSERPINAFLIRGSNDYAKKVAATLNLDAYFVLQNHRQIILISTQNKGRMNLNKISVNQEEALEITL